MKKDRTICGRSEASHSSRPLRTGAADDLLKNTSKSQENCGVRAGRFVRTVPDGQWFLTVLSGASVRFPLLGTDDRTIYFMDRLSKGLISPVQRALPAHGARP